jgi:hypothetical protein
MSGVAHRCSICQVRFLSIKSILHSLRDAPCSQLPTFPLRPPRSWREVGLSDL